MYCYMISVTIIVKDGEKRLSSVLEALKPFDEVVVVDTDSKDRTREIASSFVNVHLFSEKFCGFGKTHNVASSHATHDWILSIDADEIVTEELAEEILSLKLNKDSVYALPRHNYFNGKRIRWCGWDPQSVVRLYHRKKTAFSEVMVHEAVKEEECKVKQLKHPINHYPYDSISDFIEKMERYSTLFAEQNRLKRKVTPAGAFFRGVYRFFYSYFVRLGFLGGFEGFVISSADAITCFYKYLKLCHANQQAKQMEKNPCQKSASTFSSQPY